MSIKMMNYVWEHSKQKGTLLLLLLAIADFADDDGNAYPGIKRLAKKARTGERNCQKLLRKLVDSGEIVIEENKGAHTSSGNTNLYKVMRKGVNANSPLKTEGVNASTPHGVNASTPESSLEPSDKDSVTDDKKQRPRNIIFDATAHLVFSYAEDAKVEDDFVGVVAACYKKVYLQHNPQGTDEQVVAAMRAFKKSLKRVNMPRDLKKIQPNFMPFLQNHGQKSARRAEIQRRQQEQYRQNELFSKRLQEAIDEQQST